MLYGRSAIEVLARTAARANVPTDLAPTCVGMCFPVQVLSEYAELFPKVVDACAKALERAAQYNNIRITLDDVTHANRDRDAQLNELLLWIGNKKKVLAWRCLLAFAVANPMLSAP